MRRQQAVGEVQLTVVTVSRPLLLAVAATLSDRSIGDQLR